MERRGGWVVLLVAALIFGGGAISPPSLMDDVDAVQAQIARNMLESGDWVTARLNGVAYLEKPPLKYWMIAASFAVFGVHDWAARLPVVLSAIALCLVTARFGAWAFSEKAGLYAGLVLATCCGLFLFTRVLIADVMLTLAVTVAMWCFLRALEEESGWRWPLGFWTAMGAGFLLKGLIAMVFPLAAAVTYLAFARRLGDREVWRRLRPFTGGLACAAVVLPWVALATLRNPPHFDFAMRSGPGEYRGFFWFFFLNEHLFRFLNMRYPRDYNTVPRYLFWLFHLVWLFPWSGCLAAALRQPLQLVDRAGRVRLLCVCWTGFLMAFFTLSTSQEYYSMPCYPAVALLLGCALAAGGRWVRAGIAAAGAIMLASAAAALGLYGWVWGEPAPGDISRALTLNPDAYTLSLGHMKDLTPAAFAYLRTPLLLAAAALAVGGFGALRWRGGRAVASLTAAMILFTQAARVAMVAFDPYLSSRPLAEALERLPRGEVVFGGPYYTFSSVYFYGGLRRAWLWNGRVNNLEYGSWAPGAPDVFLDDAGFAERWRSGDLHYLLIEGPAVGRAEGVVGKMRRIAGSGGKYIFANRDPGGMLY